MKKLILSFILSLPLGAGGWLFSQSSFTITPNPTASGTVSDLKIDAQGKILKATQTYYYNASNMDFLPNDAFTSSWNAFVRDNSSTRIAFFDATRSETSYMIAPVDLPDGAVITRMKSFYIDNTSAEILFIDLIRRIKTTTSIPLASEDIMATNQSAASNLATIRTVQTATITNPTIDNNIYYYFIKVKIADCEGCDPTQNWRGNLLGIRDVELQYTY